MERNKKITAIVLLVSMLVMNAVSVFAALPEYGEEYTNQPSTSYNQLFDDVGKKHWAFGYIMEMNERGILAGYPNGNFYPENTITRAEFAKIMCLAAGLNVSAVNKTSYTDVKSTAWYAPYVETGKYYLSGYISGGKKYYRPDSNALREDIAVALVKLKGYDTSVYDESILKAMFTDWQSISEDARKYVSVAVEKGLISGYEDDTFRGQATLTRAEAATLLWRAYQYGSGNKVFEKEELDIPEVEEKKPEYIEHEDEKQEEKEDKKLSLSLKVSDTSYTVEEGESVEFQVTVSSDIEGRYIPEISGDTSILTSKTPGVKSTGYKTTCSYETKALTEGEYELKFDIEDDSKKHSKTVKIKVKKPEPLTLSLTASKTSYTVEEGESVDFKITVSANEEGEYIPEVSGDTDILNGTPDVTTKGNNTICEYETEELDAGEYELNFSIKDDLQTYEKTIKITAKEPEPEYLYEMDTLMKNIQVNHMIGTNDSLIFSKKLGEEQSKSNEIYEIKDGEITKILDSKDIGYLGNTEDGYAISSYIASLGFNSYDNCPYALICQHAGLNEGHSFYLYNLYTGEHEYYRKADTSVHSRALSEFIIDINNEIMFSYDIACSDYYCMSISVIDDTIIDGTSTIYVDRRTGKKTSKRTSYNGTLFNANNLHRYSIDDNAIYRYDLDWNEEKLLTFDDIDNVDNRRIDFKQIKYPHHFSNAIDNEGTIYFWDEKYESIRCIREK